jgi:hypothetical protein
MKLEFSKLQNSPLTIRIVVALAILIAPLWGLIVLIQKIMAYLGIGELLGQE